MLNANEARAIVKKVETQMLSRKNERIKEFCENVVAVEIETIANGGRTQTLVNCEKVKGWEQEVVDYLIEKGGYNAEVSCSGSYIIVKWAE